MKPQDSAALCERPLIVRCGAFGDMVLITALIGELQRRFRCPVDIVTSGPWSEPLLRGQPGVGEILSVRSRKTPYWLSLDQQRVVRRLKLRGPGPTWLCDGNEAALPLLTRAGITARYIVDVRDHRLLPGEHATQQWRRLAQIDPDILGTDRLPGAGMGMHAGADLRVGARADAGAGARMRAGAAADAGAGFGTGAAAGTGAPAGVVAGTPAGAGMHTGANGAGARPVSGGCHLDVSGQQRADLERWLRSRGLAGVPLIAIQAGNKRTMRRGLKRLAVNSKYWPNERWAEVLRHLHRRHGAHALVLLGTGPEHELNRELARLAAIDRLYNLADDLPVPRLVALLARADGLITVDSGPAHAAAAVGCPQVVLFGKASTSLYRPWGTADADVAVLTGQLGGEPSMLGIDAAQVIAAWDALLLRSVQKT